jgi:hypothetical protein
MDKSLALTFFIVYMSVFTALNAQTSDGYTLYSKMDNTNVYLLDMNHNVYHSWSCSVQTGYSTYLLPNHHILRSGHYNGNQLQGAAMTGMVQDIDWSGNLVWQYVYSTSTYCTHHDIHPMPNGNVLMISYEVKSAPEAVQSGCAQNIIMWPDKIVEVQPQGTNGGVIVWEWHAWDHLVQDHDATKSNYGVVADHPELLNINYNAQKDWMHTNGIDYNPVLDQITFSSHNLNELYVVDHSTTTAEAATHSGGNSGKGGDILYRWGNPAAYNRGTTSNQVFKVVHDAHWVPQGCPKENYLVGFNNKGYTGNQSCVDMINPPYSGYTYSITTGSPYLPNSVTWRHHCLSTAQDQSSSQQFPNGNMLICISSTGYMYEIDSSQNLLWSYTVGGTVAKAYRYTSCYVNGPMTAVASATPETVCTGGSVQLSVVATGGSSYTYSWTSNPPGFTSTSQNPVVMPAITTDYYVTVTSGNCTAGDTSTVVVYDVPSTPAVTQRGDTLFSSATQGNQWYLDGTLISGATANYYIPLQPGSYQVQVTGQNGCSSAMSVPFVYVGSGEISSLDPIGLFPNPTSGKLRITGIDLQNHTVEITLINSLGKMMNHVENSVTPDFSSLENGIYYMVIQMDKSKTICKKLVVIK